MVAQISLMNALQYETGGKGRGERATVRSLAPGCEATPSLEPPPHPPTTKYCGGTCVPFFMGTHYMAHLRIAL